MGVVRVAACGERCGDGGGDDDVHPSFDELVREFTQPLRAPLCEPLIDDDRLAFDVAELAQTLLEKTPVPTCKRIARGGEPQHADTRRLSGLLRSRSQV